ncbi:MAG: DinB family protein [Flammeovirgaceae bacterium]
MMHDKEKVAQLLLKAHDSFSKSVLSLSSEQLKWNKEGKWNAAELLDHIVKSVKPVHFAFALPLFLLQLMFGRTNRPSRSYEELVAKYQLKLQAGGKAPKRFCPGANIAITKQAHILQKIIAQLCARIDTLTENQLDLYILPHPLLGKITLREMLYFTIYHVEHHHKQLQANIPSS